MSLEILSPPKNPRVWKSVITSKFNGVELRLIEDVKMGETNKTEDYFIVHPFGQVPVLRHSDDREKGVFESNSIARYVARLGEKKIPLYGRDVHEASRIDGFLDAVTALEAAAGPLYSKSQNSPWAANFTKTQVDGWRETFKKLFKGFDRALKNKKWFVGDSISLADIVWFSSSHASFRALIDAEFRKEIPHAVAHFRKLEALPEVKSVVGDEVKFPETIPEPQFTAGGASAPRYHRLVTVTHGHQNVKFKIYSESTASDIQATIRARFGLSSSSHFILLDDEGFDVVVDGTLETAKYQLVIPGEGKEGKEGKDHFELLYFNIRGRAEAVRLTLEDVGADYKDVHPTDWPKTKQEGVENGKIPFGQVPVLYNGDFNVAQSNAILRYLARKFDLYGSTSSERAYVDQLLDEAEDIRNKFNKYYFGDKGAEESKQAHQKYLDQVLPFLEKWLERHDGGRDWLLGSSFSVADLSFFVVFEYHRDTGFPNLLDSYPLLKGWYSRVAARPRLAGYLHAARRLPIKS